MYQNIYVSRRDETVHLWDDKEGYKTFPYKKYAFKRQPNGPFKSIYGDELTKVVNFTESDPNLFESDVPLETRLLIDRYLDSDEPSTGHRIGVVDIEVSSEGGFPNLETADKKITGITVYDYLTKKYFAFILDEDNKVTDRETGEVVLRRFDDEDNLLSAFMDKWTECGFTIVTGWNVDYFDMPYIYLRMKNRLGAQAAKCLSPINVCYLNAYSKKVTIGGISVMDYILLYKKFSGKMEPTYALGPIGQKVVGIGKVQYHGSLDDLYKTDIDKFIEYNLTDVKIVVALDQKLQFIDLARSICHVGHVPYESFHMSSRYLDGATLMYLRRNGGLIAPNKPSQGREEYAERMEEGEEGFSGAYVKEPVPGRYNWVFDLDMTSMYPRIIISLNISPETKVAKLEGFDMEKYVAGTIFNFKVGQVDYTKDDFEELIIQKRYSISSNGVLYKTDQKGVIPTILSKWFEERQDMRKKAAEFKKAGNMEMYNFYNLRQQVWKILLNSFYGVLGLPVFRFYDVDNAEAVTTCGVSLIQSTAKAINAYYKAALETVQNGDWVIYSDTDSCFVDAVPLIKKRYPSINLEDDDAMTKAIMEVTTEVQNYVNSFYDILADRFFNLKTPRFQLKRDGKMVDTNHEFEAKQEVISKTSFWLAKKRYAQWIIHEEGALLKTPKLEVKGIDVVRTSFPSSFRKFMDGFLRKLLTSAPKKELDAMILKFKEDMKAFPVVEIAKNTSVKFVSQDGKHNYNPENRGPFQFVKGTPAQVKAGLAYNDLLQNWGLSTKYEPIHHSQKVKWVYCQQNSFGLDAIAFKGDGTDPDEVVTFIDTHVDRRAMFEQELKSKLIDFYDVFKWEFPNPTMAIASNFFEFE